MRINLPNQITIGRLLIAVVFCVTLSLVDCRRGDQQIWMIDLAFWLFIVGAVSDILDGYVARKQNQVTALGRILDPFVDKVLTGGAFILFLGTGFVNEDGRNVTGMAGWMVVVIVSREVLVTGLRGYSESEGRAYAANAFGKIKMILQSVAIGWIIQSLGRLRDVDWFLAGRPYAIWLAVIVTVASVLAYLPASRHALSETVRE